MDSEMRNRQPNSEMCFVCGRSNPVGLYMKFSDDGESEVSSEYTVPSHYQGFPGVVHGGVIAAMLDEAIGRVSVIGDHHHLMMSVKLQVKYRHPVPVEVPLTVVARIVRLRGRLGLARGEVLLPDGTVACDAEMSLADVPADIQLDIEGEELGWRIDEW